MANKESCTITLKNVPCELKTYYLQSGHDNDRCLSKEIINVLKKVKEQNENSYEGVFRELLFNMKVPPSPEFQEWIDSQRKSNATQTATANK